MVVTFVKSAGGNNEDGPNNYKTSQISEEQVHDASLKYAAAY